MLAEASKVEKENRLWRRIESTKTVAELEELEEDLLSEKKNMLDAYRVRTLAQEKEIMDPWTRIES